MFRNQSTSISSGFAREVCTRSMRRVTANKRNRSETDKYRSAENEDKFSSFLSSRRRDRRRQQGNVYFYLFIANRKTQHKANSSTTAQPIRISVKKKTIFLWPLVFVHSFSAFVGLKTKQKNAGKEMTKNLFAVAYELLCHKRNDSARTRACFDVLSSSSLVASRHVFRNNPFLCLTKIFFQRSHRFGWPVECLSYAAGNRSTRQKHLWHPPDSSTAATATICFASGDSFRSRKKKVTNVFRLSLCIVRSHSLWIFLFVHFFLLKTFFSVFFSLEK